MADDEHVDRAAEPGAADLHDADPVAGRVQGRRVRILLHVARVLRRLGELPLGAQALPGTAGSPHGGRVVAVTAAEYGPGVVPTRARTRHWSRSPGWKPASAKVGLSGVTVRLGRHTPTIAAGPVGAPSVPTGVRSIWYSVAPGTGSQFKVAKPSAWRTARPVTSCAAAVSAPTASATSAATNEVRMRSPPCSLPAAGVVPLSAVRRARRCPSGPARLEPGRPKLIDTPLTAGIATDGTPWPRRGAAPPLEGSHLPGCHCRAMGTEWNAPLTLPSKSVVVPSSLRDVIGPKDTLNLPFLLTDTLR